MVKHRITKGELKMSKGLLIRWQGIGPGWVAQSVRALSRCSKAMGSIHSQGTYRSQPKNELISRTTNPSLKSFKNKKADIVN